MNSSLVNLVITAYNSGLLQYDQMSICGFNIKLDIKKRFNVLSVEFAGIVRTVNVYDTDEYCTQESTIENLLTDVAHLADNK